MTKQMLVGLMVPMARVLQVMQRVMRTPVAPVVRVLQVFLTVRALLVARWLVVRLVMPIASVLGAMQRVTGGMQRALQLMQWVVPLVTSMMRMLQVMEWVEVPLAMSMARMS